MRETKSNSKKYSAKQFYSDIKKELEKIAPIEYLSSRYGLTYEILSLILGQVKDHISNKKQDETEIALDLMSEYQLFLEARTNLWKRNSSQLKTLHKINKIEESIKHIIRYYLNSNKLKRYARGISNVFENHPNLKVDYFANIHSKSKAYWFGWLFAEAWITQYGNSSRYKKPYYRFGVACSHKDADLIYRFAGEIGFDLNKIKSRFYQTLKGTNKLLVLRFSNFDFAEYLKWRGFIIGNQKSKNIELPKLSKRDLYLAFLLGYYDGDGKMGTTQIASGSKNFLEQIKSYFKLKNKIRLQISNYFDPIKNRFVKGSTYILYLGPDLFNEMLANYQNSLKRKRIPKYNLRQRLEKANRARLSK
jgi:hypothetical protein